MKYIKVTIASCLFVANSTSLYASAPQAAVKVAIAKASKILTGIKLTALVTIGVGTTYTGYKLYKSDYDVQKTIEAIKTAHIKSDIALGKEATLKFTDQSKLN